MAYASTHKHVITPELARGDIIDTLERTSRSLDTFRWLLFCAHDQGDGLDGDHAEGVSDLLEMHCLMLNGIRETVASVIAERDALRAENTTGREASTPVAKSIREEFIATKAREGVSPGDIAAAMNMKRATIERVIRQLQGDGTVDGSQAAVA